MEGYSFLIRTYLTDGTYTYHLYDNGLSIADDIVATNYTISNPSGNTAHQYTLKTNYYGGETTDSNMTGFTLGEATIESLELASNDMMTLTANSVLNVSNTLTNTNPANLVIENGAQLIHNGEGVQATIKKDIEAYTSDDNGWYSLATPFTTYNPEGELTLGSYDLYAYDEDGNSEGKEWINYEANTFDLTAGTGYIYANSETGSFSMTGTLNSGDYSQTVNLSYANSNNIIKGYNLLGNPTAHEINFSKTSNVSDGYYYLDNGNLWTYTPESTVPAGRGFLVKANASGQSVTLNPQSKDDSAENGQYISVSIGDNMVYIKLNEGVSMPQFDLRGRHNRLYLSSNHKHYAMLVRNGAETVDLCFEPSSNGMQTLIVDTQGLNLDYLHLIDNFTGADVNLLTTPSYTFEAQTSDYASRFKLVFAESSLSADTTDASFAYVSNGEIVVSADACDATLQIVDMTGRVMVSRSGRIQCVPTKGMATGVYMLRLITADGVKTQKIVVE